MNTNDLLWDKMPAMLDTAATLMLAYDSFRFGPPIEPRPTIVLDGTRRVHHHDGIGAIIYRCTPNDNTTKPAEKP